MAYCTLTDIEKLVPENTLIQLTDDQDTGSVDDAKIDEAITQADSEIDGYLRGRYILPLSTVPDLIRKLSVDMSIYHLYSRTIETIPETRAERYKDAVKTLKAIANGTVVLNVTNESPDNFAVSMVETDHFDSSKDT